VRVSICEFTTLTATFEEDLAAYGAAGVDGIGVCEIKLADDSARQLRETGCGRRTASRPCRRSCRCR
jgi:hypothetical protein